MIIIKRTITFILSLFITISICITAFAFNDDYIGSNSIWNNNSITTSSLNYPYGYYQYFSEKDDSSFYFHISYSLEKLNSNDVSTVLISLNNGVNSYKISINKNGIVSSSANANKSIKMLSKFTPIVGNGQEIYFGISFLNKEDKKLVNNISVSLRINNDNYKIASGIKAEFNSEQETENKTTSSSQKPNNQNKPSNNNNIEKPTKFHYNPENNNNYNNGNVQQNEQNNKSNKFNYNPNDYDENNEDIEEDSNLLNDNGEIIIPEKEKESTLSPISKVLIVVSVLLCTTGIILILHYIIKAQKSKRSMENKKQSKDKEE